MCPTVTSNSGQRTLLLFIDYYLFGYWKVEIVNNILREERVMKKRHQQQPQLWPEKQRERSKVRRHVNVAFNGFKCVVNIISTNTVFK
mgnify:CR=1 FL=1